MSAFSARQRSKDWFWIGNRPHTMDVDSSPTVVNGVVYVDSFALNARTGALLWTAAYTLLPRRRWSTG